MHLRKTKIVCTMGPTVEDKEILKQLLIKGMNLARLNFSHGDQPYHSAMIERLREASKETGIPVAIMIDLRGPEIRTGIIKDDKTIKLVKGDNIIVTTEDIEGTNKKISISHKTLHQEIKTGAHIYIADGIINLEVINVDGKNINCIVKSGGEIGSKKNVNIRGIKVSFPTITDNDKNDLLFAIKKEVDYVASSFVRSSDDIITIKKILADHKSPIHVIAKIEDEEGVKNIDKIINVSDGIMVARGDLGVQINTEDVPLVQKRIISKCNILNKPVITATQMLDSMIHNPRPTRAESSDVANAIFDGTDAVMLSGETAAGKYPILSVEIMHKIAFSVENSAEYIKRCKYISSTFEISNGIAESIASGAFSIAANVDASAILTPTLHGTTPKLISRFRPIQKIIAATTSPSVQRKLLLYWGIYPVLTKFAKDSDEMINNAIKIALNNNLVHNFDRIVIVAGIPVNSPIMINTIKVHLICNVLEKGRKGFGNLCSGKIVKAQDVSEAVIKIKGTSDKILVVKSIDDSFKPLLRQIKGLIIEDYSTISDDIIQLINPEIVCISGVSQATSTLENGIVVSLDGMQRLVYEGVVESSSK